MTVKATVNGEKLERNDVRSIRENDNSWRLHCNNGEHLHWEKEKTKMLRLSK